jgi:peptide/nickel transport system substrate-binding protein
MALKTTLPLFKDVRMRQALDYAIDKKAIIQGILKGYGQVSAGPIAPLQKFYYNPNVQQYAYNPQKALQLLAQLGYKKGAGGKLYKNGKPLTIPLTLGQYGYLVQLGELAQHYWQKIGITVPLKVIEWNTFIQKVVVNRQYVASDGWWIAPFDPDVYPYYSCSTAKVGDNLSDYCNPQLDRLMNQGRLVVQPAARKQVYNKMQTLMANQLPLLFLFYPIRFDAMTSNLHVPAVDYNIALNHMEDWWVQK